MAKTLGEALYGLTPEVKKKIRAEIKAAQSAQAQQGSQEQETYWEGLSALAKSVQDLVDKAKAAEAVAMKQRIIRTLKSAQDLVDKAIAAGKVPKGTTIEKLSSIPKSKPKRWNTLYNKLFGRKPRTKKPAASPSPKPKPRKTTPKKA